MWYVARSARWAHHSAHDSAHDAAHDSAHDAAHNAAHDSHPANRANRYRREFYRLMWNGQSLGAVILASRHCRRPSLARPLAS